MSDVTARKRTSQNGYFSSKKSTQIPSLVELCLDTIAKNLDALTDLGDISSEFIPRILCNCNAEQLNRIEKNTRRELPTNELWKKLCLKEKLLLPGEDEQNKTKVLWKKVYFSQKSAQQKKIEDAKKKAKEVYKKETDNRSRSAFIEAPPPGKSTAMRTVQKVVSGKEGKKIVSKQTQVVVPKTSSGVAKKKFSSSSTANAPKKGKNLFELARKEVIAKKVAASKFK
eukprot:TRINITY_DN659_c0_g1_i2.p1 TRINITY_DN659_c0_g1~~TRINITY_DN659_c0_g1_i2.p1  ORF type:complete len:227 (+),score=66.30 TRINITY_DN659_c0_g1_i2:86-766(+)